MSNVRQINAWFRDVTKDDINSLLEKIVLSDRQLEVFEMFYIKRKNIGFIADTICFSQRVISKELEEIRHKISAIIKH